MIRFDNRRMLPLQGGERASVGTSAAPRMGQAAVEAITAQLQVAPATWVEMYRVEFSYVGPKRQISVGWALKPRTGFFGTDWNDGLNTISGMRNFSDSLFLPDTPAAKLYVFDVIAGTLNPGTAIFMPEPGQYTLEGGGNGSIDAGAIDTWIWLVDETLIKESGLFLTDRNRMAESLLLRRAGSDSGLVDTDSGPIKLGGTGGSAMRVGYRVP